MKSLRPTPFGFVAFAKLLALMLCFTALGPAWAQGPLVPPGPPAPMFKTLDQVEPRVPIGSLPFVINKPGGYYLTTNFNAAGGTGIVISASQVTLDLMGFHLSGGTGSGILVSGARSNVWIRNGILRGWTSWGIDAGQAHDAVFEKLQLSGNGAPSAGGLRVGAASVVWQCTASGNGTGIEIAGNRNRVEANHLSLNDRGLAVTGGGNIVIHNSASGNGVDYDIAPGNDVGPIGRADMLTSPWGNIGKLQFTLNVTKTGSGNGSVQSVPGGITCGMDCTNDYVAGAVVTLTAIADAGSTFVGWSGGCSGTGPCVVTMTSNITVTATFASENYTLTVSKSGTGSGTITSSPSGIYCGAVCNESFASGTMVTLTAVADAGSTFTGWSGSGCSGTGTCTVTMDAAKHVTATFTDGNPNYLLTVVRNGSGSGTITSSPLGIYCGATCNASFSSGTMVTLTAVADAGSTFTGWSGAGCSGTGTCTVTMDAAKNVTATFMQEDNYTLTVTRVGAGTVTSSPLGIYCGATCSASFAPGTMVTLTATPDAGHSFAGWSGSGCSGTGTCTVTIDAAKSVTATFVPDSFALTVTKAGSGSGVVSSSPAGVDCGATCSGSFSSGTMVTLTATPSVGSTFAGWSGSGCSGTGTCVVTMDAAKSVTATFTLQNFTLNVARAGTGMGSVLSTPSGINCGADCTESFAYGTTVTLSAVPAVGSTFTGWSGGGCSGTGSCTVTMAAAATVTASFALNSYTLTVQRAGTGTGVVTSSPAGINCGTDCSGVYSHGTMVTLTATPAAGSVFAGWSGGGCSGTGTCTVSMDAARSVVATFNTQ